MRYKEDEVDYKKADGRAGRIHRGDARVLMKCKVHKRWWDAMVADRDRLMAFYKACSLLGLNTLDDEYGCEPGNSWDFTNEMFYQEMMEVACRIRKC